MRQDIVFLIVLAILLLRRDGRLFVIVGIMCLFTAIPLFAMLRGLFTAERLTWYAAAFFLLGTIIIMFKSSKK